MQDRNAFSNVMDKQRQFFATGATLPYSFRIEQLRKLKSLVQIHEAELTSALKNDLKKASEEAILNEIILVTREIDYVIRNLKKWMRPKRVPTPFPAMWPGRSEIHFEPYGSALIIGPWNYPFLIMISPLIGAICAGNCVVLKPSEIATNSQNKLVQLINDNFAPEYIFATKGGPEETSQLLQEKFDYVFFTGSPQIGKIVLEAAAKNLTPVTLELGGKNPCIVDETANLDLAAKRIAWAKYANVGQTCIAPDYLYVQSQVKDQLIDKLKIAVADFYGSDPETSSSYGRIINKKHFERITKLMQKGNVIIGGTNNANQLYIAPTIIDGISWNDPIMQEEIFGPLLPVFTYDKIEDLIQAIKSQPKPLSLYLFTNNREMEKIFLDRVSFGGGCINDCMMQMVNLDLPFGGVGQSGIGHYHGKFSFETFSHKKSIYKKMFPFELKLEYPPYSPKKLWWLRKLLR